MRTNISRVLTILSLCLAALFLVSATGEAQGNGKGDKGLSDQAFAELSDAGVDKYLGRYDETNLPEGTDVGDGWTKYTFDRDGGNGPTCIAGADFSAFTRDGDPKKLLIMLQGGGACWQGFYECNVLAEDQEPPVGPVGIWDFDNRDNELGKYSIVYMPYCDGSVFGGDNDVDDEDWEALTGSPKRFHRGLRNQSAGMDLAAAMFPDAEKIVVAGSSAGGVGAAAFAPFLVRFLYGNDAKVSVFNDAGPIAVNLGGADPALPFFGCLSTGDLNLSCASVVARANDWQFAQFYPASCVADGRCNPFGQQTGIIDWRLDNDTSIREAFYETDADLTNRFFAQGDGGLMPADVYRNLIDTEHGALNQNHPDRYKRFIVSTKNIEPCVLDLGPVDFGFVALSHTALQGGTLRNVEFPPNSGIRINDVCGIPVPSLDLFYEIDANGVLLNDWTRDFLRSRSGWVDIVEGFVPAPF